jgi:senataxin
MQLPATVFYPNAANILYNRSLFERFIDNKYQRHILTVQYRMQPNISKFISEVFYDNKLTNDETLSNCNKEPIYSLIKIEYNFSFFDISYGEELYEFDKKSYYNESEIEFSFRLIKYIISSIKNKINSLGENNNLENYNYDNSKKINDNNENNKMIETLYNYKFAIICPYKSQVLKFREMKKKNKFFLNKNINDIEINTVDSFQGQERDIIIFSTVRANFRDDLLNKEEGEISSIDQSNKNNVGIGFLNDYRRMNVGLSRAKFGCYVVGHYETLKNNSYWEKLINYCKDKKSFFKVDNTKESIQNSIKNILI